MSERSRDRIFSRLFAASLKSKPEDLQPADLPIATYSQKEKIEKLKTLLEAMRTEVHVTRKQIWLDKLEDVLKQKNVKNLLYGPQTPIGEALNHKWENTADDLPELVPYVKEIEELKERVFNLDAGITSTFGAVADTGAIILWSSEKEPRLMSLVPPIHIAVVQANKVYNSLLEVMQKENWSDRMPTNAFLISGPSKTADIELTLAFGVHGPKELIVLILED